ncbi:hypothetical protein [Pseudarthrobacter sp. TAF60_1]|uniref:hypothetical protein n=1 Tax=Pseudarthrobacter sp. TAF60_1 TaxID=3233071 RepID=UPI003F9EA83C
MAEQFDGAGFVRGALRKGFDPHGKRALVVGNGSVGSPIAASLAGLGLAGIGLFDPDTGASDGLARRISAHYPDVQIAVGSKDPEGYDLIVNATPLGMRDGDPMPVDIPRLLCRRRRAEGRNDPIPAGRQAEGMHSSGGQRHAVRDDPRLPRVLRIRHCDSRRTAYNSAIALMKKGLRDDEVVVSRPKASLNR